MKTPLSPLNLLLPYQKQWVENTARFKLGMWSRQTGKSFATACEAVRDCYLHPGAEWVVLSTGERQALEWMEKAKMWTKAFDFVIESEDIVRDAEQTLMKSSEIKLGNGSRILALPANAATARGYSANLILDEFAFHENPDLIWRGIYPSIANPLKTQYKLRIVTTPNGKTNKFYDLWTKNETYSKHKLDIYDAIAQGLRLDVEELKAGLDDPDGWAQEFECQFIDGASILLPYELIAKCETEDWEHGFGGTGEFYGGMDIGRKKDLSVFWLKEKIGDLLVTRKIIEMAKMPFRDQHDTVAPFVKMCRRVCVDASGIGAMLAEELAREFGKYKIEECKFTASLKEDLFLGLRRKFDDSLLRIPISRVIREDLHGLQKITSSQGQIRFQAPHNDDGHSDRATALALAVRAASDLENNFTFAPRPYHRTHTVSNRQIY
jgi:phage FluMu gp28-like protein